MGRRQSGRNYRPGSFWREDDRSGFAVRAERTRKEWTGLIVADRLWEPRQPQDLVQGVQDQQAVPEPRPIPPPIWTGPLFAQLTQAAAIGDLVLYVNSVSPFSIGDDIYVMLDSGDNYWTVVIGVGAASIEIAAGLPGSAASGNQISSLGTTSYVPYLQDNFGLPLYDNERRTILEAV